MTQKIDIKSLIKQKAESKTRWVEYRDGIHFHLRFIPRSVFKSIVDKCTSLKFSRSTRQREPQVDSNALTKLFVEKAVIDWKGVTVESLKSLTDIETRELTEAEMNEPIEYDAEVLVSLMEQTYDLDAFLQEAATDIKVFNMGLEDELKNSRSSQIGS